MSNDEASLDYTAVASVDDDQLRAVLEAQLERHLPEFLQYLALAFGRPIDLSKLDLQAPRQQFASKMATLIRLGQEIDAEPDPLMQAQRLYQYMTEMLREMEPEIPTDENLFVHFARTNNFQQPRVPEAFNNAPWHYQRRYSLYRKFLGDLVSSQGLDVVTSFNTRSFDVDGVLPQFQKVSVGTWLPKNLAKEPRRLTAKIVQRQLSAWQSVAADWDRLTRIPYGLLRLSRGKPTQWADTGGSGLRNRVDALYHVVELAELARPEWVTIRNAVQHGGAIYDPTDECVVFLDKQSKVRVAASDVRPQAIDMALSNLTMLITPLLAADTVLERLR